MTLVEEWFEACAVRDVQARTSAKDLYAAYVEWATVRGRYVGSRKGFSMRVAALGFERHRSVGVRYFIGIKLKQAEPI